MNEKKSEINEGVRAYIVETCEHIGPRSPGTKAELDCAIDVKNRLEKTLNGVNHEVVMEKFPIHPKAYKAAFHTPMILYLAVLVFYWFIPLASFLIQIISFIILFGQMVLAYPILEPFFPKQESVNVIAKIKPANPSKHIVVFGCHTDSNWEFPLMRKLGAKFSIIIAINVFLNVLLLLTVIIRQIVIWADKYTSTTIEWVIFFIFVVGATSIIIQLFLLISNRPVLGANDNLSGVAICLELAKTFAKSENMPKSTEVWITAFGSEEIGSRGSAAYVKAHFSELQNVHVINFDMICNKKAPLFLGTSELSGMVKLSPEFVKTIKEIAEKLGVPVKVGPCFGYTDTLSFARKGIASLSFISDPVDSNAFYYHTREDTFENMSLDNIEPCYSICMEWIKKIDAGE